MYDVYSNNGFFLNSYNRYRTIDKNDNIISFKKT